MTEPKHTKEPWGIEETSETLWVGPMRRSGDGKIREIVLGIDIIELSNEALGKAKANARRIVACVNALEGVPTERLEQPIETYTYGPGHEPHVWSIYGADKETSEIVCVGEDTAQMVCRALNLYGEESEGWV